jgi:hypothetical protein
MSCGPAQSVQQLVDGINGVIDSTELAISVLPKKIATIPGYAEVQLGIQIYQDLQLLKELLDDPLALLEMGIASLPLEFQQYIEAGNDLVGETLEQAEFVGSLSEKYGDVDYGDPEELLGALNDLSGDINKICEIVPNIQKRYDTFVEKGKPVSGVLSRPKNPVKQVKLATEKRYQDVYDSAVARSDAAKEDAKDPNSALSKSVFGSNKSEVDITKQEQRKFVST